jgi:hypothetical protein
MIKGFTRPIEMFDGKLKLPALKLPAGINTGRALVSPSAA